MAKRLDDPMRGINLHGPTYRLSMRVNGERKYIPLHTADPGVAVTRARAVRANPDMEGSTEVATTVESYLTHKLHMNEFSTQSARVAGDNLREFARFVGGKPLEAIAPEDIDLHYHTLQDRVAESTAQIHMRGIRAFLNWCVEKRKIVISPARELKLKKIDQRAKLLFCTAEQRDLLLAQAPTDDLRFILYCGFHAGLRKNEIIEARVKWFNLGGKKVMGAVTVQNSPTFRTKNGKSRFVPLTDEFRNFLRSYLAGKDPDDWALHPKVAHGTGQYRYDFERPYKDYINVMKMRWVTAHVMRHTFASLLAQSGVSIYKVSSWIGDGVEVTTGHYAHLSPQDRDLERAFKRLS